MGLLKVPAGKKLILKAKSGSILPDVDLILQDEVSLSFSNRFEPIIGDGVSKIGALAGSGLNAAIGAFGSDFRVGTTTKELGFSYWAGSGPIQFSMTVALHMKTDAKKDVWDPHMKILNLALPREPEKGVGLIAPGPDITQLFGKSPETNSQSLSARIGNLFLDWVVIVKAEPTYSLDTDEDDYPVWIKLQLDVQTVFNSYAGLLQDGRNS